MPYTPYRLPGSKVIKYLEFKCTQCGTTQVQKIENPDIGEDYYYSDWKYKYIELTCTSCNHTVAI